MKLKVAFMGTPEFAIPALELIYKSFDLVGCFTQPSRPAGRGQKISHSPIKNFCTKNNIPIYTPENFTKKYGKPELIIARHIYEHSQNIHKTLGKVEKTTSVALRASEGHGQRRCFPCFHNSP